ncbi:MAG: hypothetical protein SOT46_09695 [Treponema sp.]|nr:hypothetical protein [Treponema sp.]
MGAFPFKIYSQKHIISTEFYVEFMCFWDNVLIMDTGRDQDSAIQAAAEERVKNFGRYKVIRNNCTEYATNCLKEGGWNTNVKVIPNSERKQLQKNNDLRPTENWTKPETK